MMKMLEWSKLLAAHILYVYVDINQSLLSNTQQTQWSKLTTTSNATNETFTQNFAPCDGNDKYVIW